MIFLFSSIMLVGAQDVLPQSYPTRKECEEKSGLFSCYSDMCDYIPPGKTVEEVCGKGYKKGWWLPIDTKEKCGTRGGKWGQHGKWLREYCILPTGDFGKVCNDASECEGVCIAELTPEEKQMLVEKFGQVTITKTGKCSQWPAMFGCYPRVEAGKVKEILCAD